MDWYTFPSIKPNTKSLTVNLLTIISVGYIPFIFSLSKCPSFLHLPSNQYVFNFL